MSSPHTYIQVGCNTSDCDIYLVLLDALQLLLSGLFGRYGNDRVIVDASLVKLLFDHIGPWWRGWRSRVSVWYRGTILKHNILTHKTVDKNLNIQVRNNLYKNEQKPRLENIGLRK